MFPNINPKQMEAMMKRMGIKQEVIPAIEVIIRCPDTIITISSPSVTKINMMGQESFQISGRVSEAKQESMPEISEADIATVAKQAGVGRDEAKRALEETQGDIARAILRLTK